MKTKKRTGKKNIQVLSLSLSLLCMKKWRRKEKNDDAWKKKKFRRRTDTWIDRQQSSRNVFLSLAWRDKATTSEQELNSFNETVREQTVKMEAANRKHRRDAVEEEQVCFCLQERQTSRYNKAFVTNDFVKSNQSLRTREARKSRKKWKKERNYTLTLIQSS